MTSPEHPALPDRTGTEKRSTPVPATRIAAAAVDAALEKKAGDVVAMDVRGISGVADIFVICTGNSDIQIKAIAEGVRGDLRTRFGERPWHVEGLDHLQWVLLDYVDVVVHVFAEDRRTFYDLERLWGDADIVSVPEDGSSENVSFLQTKDPASERNEDRL